VDLIVNSVLVTKVHNKMFLFNTQQIVFLQIVVFSFYMLFLVSAFCPVYYSSDVLTVGFTFRINIPLRNPYAGVDKGALGRTADWSQGSLYMKFD
jgi:hypothetical protein